MFKKLFCLLFILGAVNSFAQSPIDYEPAIRSARNYLKEHKKELLLSEIEIDQLQVSKTGYSKKSGVSHIYFTQTYNKIEIYNAVINVHVDKSGKVINMGDRSVQFKRSTNNINTRASVSMEDAIGYAARDMGILSSERPVIVKNSSLSIIPIYKQATIFENKEVSLDHIPVKQLYVLNEQNEMVLAWDFILAHPNKKEKWNYHINAGNGEVLDKITMIYECNFGHVHQTDVHGKEQLCRSSAEARQYEDGTDGASYNVFAVPLESPNFGSRSIVTNPADDIASPFGWHDINGAAGAEYTITRGNNVYAYTDVDANNVPDANSSPDGGVTLNFNFPLDLGQAPSTYRPAAVTNMFYMCNIMHDWSHKYGFDEANGNFQQNNYGNGGLGSDPVNAEAQDGNGVNNANYSHTIDGASPRIQMYLWTNANPDRDGDFDNGIIGHEYGHGISLRLTGNGSSCLAGNEQMGEGWADYFGYMTTWVAGTNLTSSRGIGTYALNQPPNGVGIRTKKYSYDFAVNDFTYDDIKTLAVPHGVGSVWATMLWDMTLLLIEEHGEAVGLDISANIVMEGLKLQPCNPGFVDGRDAILLADQLLYGGENKCLIWDAFARRGLGVNAIQGTVGSATDGTENFDTPESIVASFATFTSTCSAFGTLEFQGGGYPLGGVYSGPGVTDNGNGINYDFNPVTAGPGTHTITYTIAADACYPGATVTDMIEVIPDFELVCPGNISGTCNTPVTYTMPTLTGGCNTLLQDFDGVAAPALPVGWSSTNDQGVPNPWFTATDQKSSSPNSMHVLEPDVVSLSSLISPIYPVNASTGISFNFNYSTEPTYDGVVLEYSINNGGIWQDITTGGTFVSGGYNSTFNTNSDNPIEGRSAWTGNSQGFKKVEVDLNASLAGNNIIFRWRKATDTGTNGLGVWIDDFMVTGVLNDNPIVQTAGLPSGSVFPAGTTTNTFSKLLFDGRTITCSFNVTIPEGIEATATANPNPICIGGTLNLDVTAGTSYSWSGPNNFTSSIKNPSIPNIQMSGNGLYSVTVSNANGCIDIATIDVTVTPMTVATATPSAQTVCSNNPIIPIILGGSVNGTTFTWTRDNTAGVTGIAASGSGNISGTLVNTTASPVTVTFTIVPAAGSCNGNTITATVVVTPSPNAISTPAVQTICSGNAISSIILSGNNAGTVYNWTRDNTGSVTGIPASGTGNISGSLNLVGNAPVTVTFTITPVLNDCVGTPVTATITVNPVPGATATPANQTICSGNTITPIAIAGSFGGITFNWTRNNTATVSGIAASGTGNISGSLVNTTNAPVTVTFTIIPSISGCSGSAITATIVVNPAPTAVATPSSQTICTGNAINTIVLSGAVSGTIFNWTRDNTASVTGIATSGTGNISGVLTNTTNAPLTVTFTITPTANGCTGAPITATVIVATNIVATATPTTQTICSGAQITPIVLSGGLPGTVYSWTRNNTATVTGIPASGTGNILGSLINNTAAPVTVTFTVTINVVGCNTTPVTATVIVNPQSQGTISVSQNPVCVGSILQLSVSGGSFYDWEGPQGWTSAQQNPSFTVANHLQAGTYNVTITSSGGCTQVLSTNIAVLYPPEAAMDYTIHTACQGEDLNLFGSGAGSYSWSGPQGWTSLKQNPVIDDVTISQSGIYTLVVTSPNGCTSTVSKNITINQAPALSANPQTSLVCEGNKLFLNASGSGSFLWNGPAGYTSTDQNPVIENIPLYMSGIYTVSLTGSTGCIASSTVEVKVFGQINVIASAAPDTVCTGQSLQLHAEGGSSYIWNGPNGFNSYESDPRIDNMTMAGAGKYQVYVYNEGGCFNYSEVNVFVKQAVKALAYASPNPAPEYSPVYFTASNGVSYQWSGPLGFASTLQNPSIKRVTRYMAGIYTVTITNETGCPSIVKVHLRVNYTNKNNTFVTTDESELVKRSEQTANVYPNPTNDLLYFDVNNAGRIEYMIYDVSGKIQSDVQSTEDSYISTRHMPSGVYLIRWKVDDASEWFENRFVKIK